MVFLQSKLRIRQIRIGGFLYETNIGVCYGLCPVYYRGTVERASFDRDVYGIKNGNRQGPEVRMDESTCSRIRRDQGRERQDCGLGRRIDEPESSTLLWLDRQNGAGWRYRLCDRYVCEKWRSVHDRKPNETRRRPR